MAQKPTELETLAMSTPGVWKIAFGLNAALGAFEASQYFLGDQTGNHTLFNMVVPATVALTLAHLRHRLFQEELKDAVKDLKGQLLGAKDALAEATSARVDEVADIAAKLDGPKLNAVGRSI